METAEKAPKKSSWTKAKKQKAAIIVLAVALVGFIAYHVLDKQGYIDKWSASMKSTEDEKNPEEKEDPNA